MTLISEQDCRQLLFVQVPWSCAHCKSSLQTSLEVRGSLLGHSTVLVSLESRSTVVWYSNICFVACYKSAHQYFHSYFRIFLASGLLWKMKRNLNLFANSQPEYFLSCLLQVNWNTDIWVFVYFKLNFENKEARSLEIRTRWLKHIQLFWGKAEI